jgi:DegV family protein with EDD domain
VVVAGVDYQEGQISLSKIEAAQRGGKEVKTSAPSPGSAKEIFALAYREGYRQILAVAVSSHGSGTYNSFKVAASELIGEVEGPLQIEVVDSYSTAMGLGLLVLRMAEEIAAGVSFTKVVDLANAARWNMFLVAALFTTKYAQAHGRVKRWGLILTSKLRLHPTVVVLPNCQPERFGLPHRKMESACKVLVLKVKELWRPEGRLSVVHCDDLQTALRVAGALSAELNVPLGEIIVTEASAVLAGQAGYKAIGIAVDLGVPIKWNSKPILPSLIERLRI